MLNKDARVTWIEPRTLIDHFDGVVRRVGLHGEIAERLGLQHRGAVAGDGDLAHEEIKAWLDDGIVVLNLDAEEVTPVARIEGRVGHGSDGPRRIRESGSLARNCSACRQLPWSG